MTLSRWSSFAGRAVTEIARGAGCRVELYQRATEQDIAGRSKMRREELIDALARAGRHRKKSAA